MNIDKNSNLFKYISQAQKDLILQGEYLVNKVIAEGKFIFFDYSFIVFPFAKAYEGFLKQIFLDVKFINRLDYISDHFRLGKVLSPNLVQKLGERSVFQKISQTAGVEFAQKIWQTWKIGRNQVFHYFPHNIKSLNFNEAKEIADKILETMNKAILELKIYRWQLKLHRHNAF
ncbi:MAG: hypothetical protein ACD_7C00345G0001 [uncultured bacterium]|nr:MAG: hypothetical protein ACD_7C00345G0001 [uncultured bacterium]